jgi:hypothetical protein
VTLEGHPIAWTSATLALDSRQVSRRDSPWPCRGRPVGRRLAAPPWTAPALPPAGTFTCSAQGVPAALLKPWLPLATGLEGELAGQAQGRFLGKGTLAPPGRGLPVQRPPQPPCTAQGGDRGTPPQRFALLAWQGETLPGRLVGGACGTGRGPRPLPPSPARPPSPGPGPPGPPEGDPPGPFTEQGLLSSPLSRLDPGKPRPGRGGPRTRRDLGRSPARRPLDIVPGRGVPPQAGIRVQKLEGEARLDGDLLRITGLKAASGPGTLTAQAEIRLGQGRILNYRGRIAGDRFQALHLPELQLLASPQLTFSGTPERLTLRGELLLPELLVTGPPAGAVARPSSDVVLAGTGRSDTKDRPLTLDAQILVRLGEKVFARLEGIDAQLGGAIDLAFTSLERMTSRGEIRVVQGRYRAYGVDLEILRGRLFYNGGPIHQPHLDILALRTVGEVKAGITVGGTLRSPAVRLFSDPALPDVDILSYIVFGKPLTGSTGTEQLGMMAQAAGALLSKGDSASLQEKLRNFLGLSTLELQSGPEALPGEWLSGAPVEPIWRRAGTTTSLPQTILTLGKYLTPRLYISYGRSLFTGANLSGSATTSFGSGSWRPKPARKAGWTSTTGSNFADAPSALPPGASLTWAAAGVKPSATGAAPPDLGLTPSSLPRPAFRVRRAHPTVEEMTMANRLPAERNQGYYDARAERQPPGRTGGPSGPGGAPGLPLRLRAGAGLPPFPGRAGLRSRGHRLLCRLRPGPGPQKAHHARAAAGRAALRRLSGRSRGSAQADLHLPRPPLRSRRPRRGLLGSAQMPLQRRVPARRPGDEHLLPPPLPGGLFLDEPQGIGCTLVPTGVATPRFRCAPWWSSRSTLSRHRLLPPDPEREVAEIGLRCGPSIFPSRSPSWGGRSSRLPAA